MTEKRFDVVIKDMKGKVVSVAGRDLSEEKADRRQLTALGRIDLQNYFVAIVPAKKQVAS